MCGRYTLTRFDHPLLERLPPSLARPSWNRAPGTIAPVVGMGEAGEPGVAPMYWGFRPHFMADAPELINARAETVAEKPMFRQAYRQQRCLVPADGFYEWQRTEQGKQPHFICRPDREPFFFAGLWTRLSEPAREDCRHGYAILTTAARESLRPIHEREPVILPEAELEIWMAPDSGPGRLALAIGGGERPELEHWPVSTRVNRPENDSPECIAPLG